jgi:uncharacterized protein (DUF2147 family)
MSNTPRRTPTLTALCLLATLALPARAMAAPSPIGRWQTAERGGVVEIFACGAALCGRIAGGPQLDAHPDQRDINNPDPALRSRLLKGLVFMTGFTGGPAEWKGGKIYRATNGKSYTGSVALVGADILKLTGCIVSPLCQTQTWRRIR